jgi:hypothetical protein
MKDEIMKKAEKMSFIRAMKDKTSDEPGKMSLIIPL